MEEIDYVTIVPGLKHFECTRQHATISSRTCAARHSDALANREDERLDICRKCPVGAAHLAEQLPVVDPGAAGSTDPDEVTISTPTLRVSGQSCFDNPKRCLRCGVVASRVVGKKLCPSCWNRQAEFVRGRNAKGRVPLMYVPPIPWRVGVVQADGSSGYAVGMGQNALEPVASLIRFNSGVKFHAGQPGPSRWNAVREQFEYHDQTGRVLIELELDGELHFVAVDEVRPGEVPARVVGAVQMMPSAVVAKWVGLTGRDALRPEWRPSGFVCGDCRQAVILVRARACLVVCRCPACGQEAVA